MGLPRIISAAARPLALVALCFSLVGCGLSVGGTEVSGRTAADRKQASAIADYLDSTDDFDWPDKVSVEGRVVTLWYTDWFGDTWHVDVEVDDALGGGQLSAGWTLVYRDSSTNRVFNTVRLPVTTADPSPEPD